MPEIQINPAQRRTKIARRRAVAAAAIGMVIAGWLIFQRSQHGVVAPESYGLRVVHGPVKDPRTVPASGNSGIYLGGGLVLTAAHVAGNPDGLGILVGDQWTPAQMVKAGNFEILDISVLSVDAKALPATLRSLPRLALCSQSPMVGQEVDVIEPGRTTHSIIISPESLPPGISWQFSSLIRDVATTGNSGSGVFDHRSRCLMGIMSRKIERILKENGSVTRTEGVAKYFVPADKISAVLGSLPP